MSASTTSSVVIQEELDLAMQVFDPKTMAFDPDAVSEPDKRWYEKDARWAVYRSKAVKLSGPLIWQDEVKLACEDGRRIVFRERIVENVMAGCEGKYGIVYGTTKHAKYAARVDGPNFGELMQVYDNQFDQLSKGETDYIMKKTGTWPVAFMDDPSNYIDLNPLVKKNQENRRRELEEEEAAQPKKKKTRFEKMLEKEMKLQSPSRAQLVEAQLGKCPYQKEPFINQPSEVDQYMNSDVTSTRPLRSVHKFCLEQENTNKLTVLRTCLDRARWDRHLKDDSNEYKVADATLEVKEKASALEGLTQTPTGESAAEARLALLSAEKNLEEKLHSQMEDCLVRKCLDYKHQENQILEGLPTSLAFETEAMFEFAEIESEVLGTGKSKF